MQTEDIIINLLSDNVGFFKKVGLFFNLIFSKQNNKHLIQQLVFIKNNRELVDYVLENNIKIKLQKQLDDVRIEKENYIESIKNGNKKQKMYSYLDKSDIVDDFRRKYDKDIEETIIHYETLEALKNIKIQYNNEQTS